MPSILISGGRVIDPLSGRNGAFDLVHSAGSKEQALGAAGLQAPPGFNCDMGDAVPVAGLLHGREGREVDALDRQQGAVQAAEPSRNPPVQMFVVERGGRPTRAADDSQLLQSGAPFPKRAPTARSGWGLQPRNTVVPLTYSRNLARNITGT